VRSPSQFEEVWRSLREFFGVCADRVPASRAMKLGSIVAAFAYVMLLVGLILLFLVSRFPELGESIRFRIASTVGVVAAVSLVKMVPVMPCRFRLGMVAAWAVIAVFSDDVRRISSDNSARSINSDAPHCVISMDREPPVALYLDSFAFAIESDLAALSPGSYLDLIYTAVLMHSVYITDAPPKDVTAALREIGLEGAAYERFGRDLARYRFREADGEGFMDTWFCGFDLECGTCDDRTATYPMPMSRWTTTLPSLRRDTTLNSSLYRRPG